MSDEASRGVLQNQLSLESPSDDLPFMESDSDAELRRLAIYRYSYLLVGFVTDNGEFGEVFEEPIRKVLYEMSLRNGDFVLGLVHGG